MGKRNAVIAHMVSLGVGCQNKIGKKYFEFFRIIMSLSIPASGHIMLEHLRSEERENSTSEA